MRQHCVHPPPGSKKQESKFARQLRGQVGAKGSVTARQVRRPVPKESGAATDRDWRGEASHITSTNPEARVYQALELIRADDMRLLLGMKRPPEIVKKVIVRRPKHMSNPFPSFLGIRIVDDCGFAFRHNRVRYFLGSSARVGAPTARCGLIS